MKKRWRTLLSLCLCLGMMGNITAYADYHNALIVPPIPISGEQNGDSSNKVTTMKQPEVQAEGAVLLDASTGKILFGKNENTRYYPASITKLMTALLVLENCSLDDMVTFSKTATTNLEAGSVSLNLTEGDKLTVRDSLYALMLKSANEVANGLAEKVSGSISGFAGKMNDRARALGCTNTNFVNPHGLNNVNHYTTPYDMALIAREAFKNETLCKISSTLKYTIPATKKVSTERTITMGHKMLYPTDSRYYPGIVAGKTGYTSLAGNTLVTCAEKNGVRLIAVVMKAKSTHYTDTKAMLDYGFEHYQTLVNGNGATKNCWKQDSTGWYFIKSDGNYARSEWMNIDGSDYWFDSTGYMATNWRKFDDGSWYYFKDSGAMATNRWVQNNGQWFYLGADGKMLTNTVTPDGYKVNQYGVWEQ